MKTTKIKFNSAFYRTSAHVLAILGKFPNATDGQLAKTLGCTIANIQYALRGLRKSKHISLKTIRQGGVIRTCTILKEMDAPVSFKHKTIK